MEMCKLSGLILINLGFSLLNHLYYQQFIPRILQQVYGNFVELFPTQSKQLPDLKELNPALITAHKPSKSQMGLNIVLSLSGAWIAIKLSILNNTGLDFALWLCAYGQIAWLIARLDSTYQLIPSELCLIFYALMGIGSHLNYLELNLVNSLANGILSMWICYGVYYISKFFYGREALGRGDCWLMLPLGASMYIDTMPILVIIACFLGISVWAIYYCRGTKIHQLPFGKYLVISQLFCFLEIFIFRPLNFTTAF